MVNSEDVLREILGARQAGFEPVGGAAGRAGGGRGHRHHALAGRAGRGPDRGRGPRSSATAAGGERGGMTEPTPVWKLLQVIGRVGTTLLFDLKVYGSHRMPKKAGCCWCPTTRATSTRCCWACVCRVRSATWPRQACSSSRPSRGSSLAGRVSGAAGGGRYPGPQGGHQRATGGARLMIFPEGSRSPDNEPAADRARNRPGDS